MRGACAPHGARKGQGGVRAVDAVPAVGGSVRVASVQRCVSASAELCNRGTRPMVARPLFTRSWVHNCFPHPPAKTVTDRDIASWWGALSIEVWRTCGKLGGRGSPCHVSRGTLCGPLPTPALLGPMLADWEYLRCGSNIAILCTVGRGTAPAHAATIPPLRSRDGDSPSGGAEAIRGATAHRCHIRTTSQGCPRIASPLSWGRIGQSVPRVEG